MSDSHPPGVPMVPMACPSNECQIRRQCIGHASCTGEHPGSHRDQRVTAADLAAVRAREMADIAPQPVEVAIGSTVHAQCGEAVVTGAVTRIERSAIATV